MLGIHDLPAFLAAGIALNLLPGPDTFYILGRSLTQGRTAGIVSALGISTGALCHTLAAALGLSAILASSATAFLLVKYLGAAYLVFLGGQLLLTRDQAAPATGAIATAALWTSFRQGVLTNLANPKVALFFLAFLPQFIVPGNPYGALPFLALGTLFVSTGTLWCLLLACCAAPLATRLRQQSGGQTLLRRITGGLFVGMGLKLAGEQLP